MKRISYANRNTLVLLLVLILFAGVAWGYISYYQEPIVSKLQKDLAAKEKELTQKEAIAARYDILLKTYREANEYFKNYDKALYQSNNEDKIFEFLTALNRGSAYNDFNFIFADSTTYEKYGVLSMEINGSGYYRNVVNFVRAIELSEPLNKVRNLNISPIKKDSSYNYVQYSFDLTSYYDRTKILEKRTPEANYNTYASVFNPFYPLIHDIKPNLSDKINVNRSELIAFSTGSVFLIDQNGILHQLKIGDEVYLGRLSDINLRDRTATFTLNKGGIIDEVTLGNKIKIEE